jgi:hypothetical protein
VTTSRQSLLAAWLGHANLPIQTKQTKSGTRKMSVEEQKQIDISNLDEIEEEIVFQAKTRPGIFPEVQSRSQSNRCKRNTIQDTGRPTSEKILPQDTTCIQW